MSPHPGSSRVQGEFDARSVGENRAQGERACILKSAGLPTAEGREQLPDHFAFIEGFRGNLDDFDPPR